MPADRFLQLVKDKRTFREVVDYFFVTPEFVINRAKRIYRNLPARELRRYINNPTFRVIT